MEVFLKKMLLNILQNSQENTCTGVSFLSTASNLQSWWLFPQKDSIIDVYLGSKYFSVKYKYFSVSLTDLKPIYKDIHLWKSVLKIATVLYYHHSFIIHRDEIA